MELLAAWMKMQNDNLMGKSVDTARTGIVGRMLDARSAAYVACLLCAFVTFIVYLKAITFGFVNWDDNQYILGNVLFEKTGWNFLNDVFIYTFASNWHPLTMMSYKIDYIFWGDDPMGYHLTNVILHTVATGLVFVFGYRIFLVVFKGDNRRRAVIAAASIAAILFGVHPLHVESVAWVSERKDILSALFFVASMVLYLRYRHVDEVRKKTFYVLSLFAFVLALLSKPMAVTLPVVLLILDFYPLMRISSLKTLVAEIINKIPFFVFSAAVSVVTILIQKHGMLTLESKPLSMRLAHALSAYVFYLRKALIPDVLLPYYAPTPNISFFSVSVIVSAVVALGITAISIVWLRRRPYVAAVWASYVLTLLPVIGILQVGGQAAADRYMYIPSIGLFLIAGAGMAALLFLLPHAKPVKAGIAVTVAALLVLMTIKTSFQISIWKDSYTLWTHQIEHFDGKVFPLPLAKRAMHLFSIGRVDEAIADLTMAINANPENWILYAVRAPVYEKKGEIDKAILDYKVAVALNKAWAAFGYEYLALLFRGAGNDKKARYYESLNMRLSRGEVLSDKEFWVSVSPVQIEVKAASKGEGL
ncbi:MAG: tetratricopeptide repeat protein [Deltaproteobacteria bacterium]|nr:tetratricopeptide repeat protein [Deltaproteobacteria bacterium]